MRRLAMMVPIVAVLSCKGDAITSIVSRAFSFATMTPKGVSIALGTSQQFAVLPKDSLGSPIPGLPGAAFRSTDTTKVVVDASGLAKAIAVGSAQIIGSVQADNLTYADTTTVTVIPTPKVLNGFALSPRTATIGAGSGQTLTATSTDPNGAKIFGLGQPFYISTSPTKAIVTTSGRVTGVSPGLTMIAATITVNGVTKTDTVSITVTNPLTAQVSINFGSTSFSPQTVTIVPAGKVTWNNNSQTSVDVTFDDPTNVTGGNIPAFTSGSFSRTFPTAGTYTYRSTTSGATGKVIVQ